MLSERGLKVGAHLALKVVVDYGRRGLGAEVVQVHVPVVPHVPQQVTQRGEVSGSSTGARRRSRFFHCGAAQLPSRGEDHEADEAVEEGADLLVDALTVPRVQERVDVVPAERKSRSRRGGSREKG